mmetsp:Transcript_52531/g.139676  ORF Transcript_52531/g.139676 Transcript_52531/m.139676 type:complete len:223 (+) Transcript_52531:465-1133(+)
MSNGNAKRRRSIVRAACAICTITLVAAPPAGQNRTAPPRWEQQGEEPCKRRGVGCVGRQPASEWWQRSVGHPVLGPGGRQGASRAGTQCARADAPCAAGRVRAGEAPWTAALALWRRRLALRRPSSGRTALGPLPGLGGPLRGQGGPLRGPRGAAPRPGGASAAGGPLAPRSADEKWSGGRRLGAQAHVRCTGGRRGEKAGRGGRRRSAGPGQTGAPSAEAP